MAEDSLLKPVIQRSYLFLSKSLDLPPMMT